MEKGFSASDICRLIRTCADSGVSDLCLGDLRVIFKDSKPVEVDNSLVDNQIMDEGQLVRQDAVSGEVTERDEIAHKEEMLAQMEIEDPVAFERLMVTGDLIDSKVGEPDERHSGAE